MGALRTGYSRHARGTLIVGATAEYEERLSDRLQRAIENRDWRDILCAAGVDERYLVNRHGPCPVCGDNRPRFRFDNREGTGSWICVCGYGSGMTLLMKATGRSFTQAALRIIELFERPGTAAAVQGLKSRAYVPSVKTELSEDEVLRRRANLMRRWQEARRVEVGDPVWKYLTGRLPGLQAVPSVIRFHPGMEFKEKAAVTDQPDVSYGRFPTMLAAVMDENGRCCNLHRTYLNDDGSRLKIERDGELLSAKRLMPSLGAKSFAIRLAPHAGRLGIGEGIETAIAAQLTEGLPTWSVVNTAGMKKFIVPADVSELVVFADNDEVTRQGKRPGFEAATALADREDVVARVKARKLKVSLVTPARRGHDMANLLLEAHALRRAGKK